MSAQSPRGISNADGRGVGGASVAAAKAAASPRLVWVLLGWLTVLHHGKQDASLGEALTALRGWQPPDDHAVCWVCGCSCRHRVLGREACRSRGGGVRVRVQVLWRLPVSRALSLELSCAGLTRLVALIGMCDVKTAGGRARLAQRVVGAYALQQCDDLNRRWRQRAGRCCRSLWRLAGGPCVSRPGPRWRTMDARR